jgi:hypothetical protein
MDEDEDGDDETPAENGMVNGHGDGPSETSKSKVRLSYEDYKHMANLMIMHIRHEEDKREGRTGMDLLGGAPLLALENGGTQFPYQIHFWI